ncbi:hypothetical protein [Novosphingobium sp. FKTRR1]|uniref:hypothetical protein n=1 Tax=unclassified Novosphingobium TaxID=2644732 RepID=UPI001CF0617F|nr:hypothetical protein [Novosphingobium sp. FKTRR1]
MSADRARIARLHRLERIRAVARRNALAAAGQAEARLAQLQALAERTSAMISDYAQRRDAQDGAALQQAHRFMQGLHGIVGNTEQDIIRARAIADQRAQEAASAERSRAAVEDRADVEMRSLARKLASANTPTGGRRKRD